MSVLILKKMAIGIILLFSIVLIAVYISAAINKKNSPSVSVSPDLQTSDALEHANTLSEVNASYPDLPIYFTDIQQRTVTNTENGIEIKAIINGDLDNIVFWHIDELEQEGWAVHNVADTKNYELQTFSAAKDDLTVSFTAEKINQSEVSMNILISK